VKVGIAASMWRGLADLPFPEFVAYCKGAGAEVMELSGWPDSYAKTLTLDDAGVRQVQDAGIEICAVACPSELVQSTPEGRAEQVALMKRHVDLAVQLGATTVGLKAGNPLEGMSVDEAQELITETIKGAAAYAHQHHVFLALENGGQVTNDHKRLVKIVNDVHDLYTRALPDTGNFLRFGYSPTEVLDIVAELAPISSHLHLKDGRGHRRDFKDTALGEGELDCERMLRLIRVSGYLWPICVQYEGPDQPGVYARNVQWVKERVGGWENNGGVVRGVHHVSVSSVSFESAYRFYGELLGLPLRPAQGISYSPVLFFELPTGEELHTHLYGPSTRMHIAIEVADFQLVLDRLCEAGLEVRGPDRRGDGSDFLFTHDFDGNSLEITHHKSWSHHQIVRRA